MPAKAHPRRAEVGIGITGQEGRLVEHHARVPDARRPSQDREDRLADHGLDREEQGRPQEHRRPVQPGWCRARHAHFVPRPVSRNVTTARSRLASLDRSPTISGNGREASEAGEPSPSNQHRSNPRGSSLATSPTDRQPTEIPGIPASLPETDPGEVRGEREGRGSPAVRFRRRRPRGGPAARRRDAPVAAGPLPRALPRPEGSSRGDRDGAPGALAGHAAEADPPRGHQGGDRLRPARPPDAPVGPGVEPRPDPRVAQAPAGRSWSAP